MKTLLDTNILVHAYNKSSPHQEKASSIIRKALRGEIDAILAPQILYEFYATVTNPRRVEHPIPPDEAADLCLDLWGCPEIEKASPTRMAPREVFRLAKELNLSRARIFDCVLAVTARENKLEAIYTENVDDFKDYPFIKAQNPLV